MSRDALEVQEAPEEERRRIRRELEAALRVNDPLIDLVYELERKTGKTVREIIGVGLSAFHFMTVVLDKAKFANALMAMQLEEETKEKPEEGQSDG